MATRKNASRDQAGRGHDESEAEDLLRRALELARLPPQAAELAKLRKGDPRKVLVAVLIRKHTSVGNRWLAGRLSMGHTAGLSRLLGTFQKDASSQIALAKLEKMLR